MTKNNYFDSGDPISITTEIIYKSWKKINKSTKKIIVNLEILNYF